MKPKTFWHCQIHVGVSFTRSWFSLSFSFYFSLSVSVSRSLSRTCLSIFCSLGCWIWVKTCVCVLYSYAPSSNIQNVKMSSKSGISFSHLLVRCAFINFETHQCVHIKSRFQYNYGAHVYCSNGFSLTHSSASAKNAAAAVAAIITATKAA